MKNLAIVAASAVCFLLVFSYATSDDVERAERFNNQTLPVSNAPVKPVSEYWSKEQAKAVCDEIVMHAELAMMLHQYSDNMKIVETTRQLMSRLETEGHDRAKFQISEFMKLAKERDPIYKTENEKVAAVGLFGKWAGNKCVEAAAAKIR